jgi:hypothetical protein
MELATSADPGNATYQHNLGETYWLLRRYAAADRTFERATAINPRWGREYSYRAAVRLCQTGNLRDAESVLDGASSIPSLLDGTEVSDRAVRFNFLARRYGDVLKQLDGIGLDAFSWQHYYVSVSRLRCMRSSRNDWREHHERIRRRPDGSEKRQGRDRRVRGDDPWTIFPITIPPLRARLPKATCDSTAPAFRSCLRHHLVSSTAPETVGRRRRCSPPPWPIASS